MTAVETVSRPREQTRARYPDQSGYVERDGVRVFYEVYGTGEPTVLLLPTWSIVHSRFWKLQIPYLARHCRVVTFDGRGNGRSDRPVGAEANSTGEFAADALYISSPIGLGHARRDAAIAAELRRMHPDIEIDWLAQHPVTAVLEASGERIHPASAQLANESAPHPVRVRRA